jgi:5-oxoprolinase (ATP-hydrolysing) subunit C
MIEIVRAPAFATIQDGGREGQRRSGVPPGGAMDLLSLRTGNAILGNDWNAAAIECALTGGTFHFSTDSAVVLTGAEVDAKVAGSQVQHGRVVEARRGETLEIERIVRGRFVYVCVAGGVDVPVVLGGRGTYLPASLGGYHGRRLANGDVLPTGEASVRAQRNLQLPSALDEGADGIAVLRGPQADVLTPSGWQALLSSELTLTAESDRAGYRLHGARVATDHSFDGRSEPACVGAVQLTPDGTLIVLMPDGPTVGGYPKIAVVASAELPRLVQRTPGESVRLRLCDMREAHTMLRAQAGMIRDAATLTRS